MMKEIKLDYKQVLKAETFISQTERHSFTETKGICDILSILDEVYIRSGYTLDAYHSSYGLGSDYKLYPRREDAKTPFQAEIMEKKKPRNSNKKVTIDFSDECKLVPFEFHDDMILTGTQPCSIKEYIPSIDAYVRVADTAEGIWQLYLLNIATDYMPLGWHSNYRRTTRIFTQDSLKMESKKRGIDFGEYINYDPTPRVIWKDEGVATVECWYFNDWSGLCKEYITFTKTPEGYYIQTGCKVDVLVKYHCGILF